MVTTSKEANKPPRHCRRTAVFALTAESVYCDATLSERAGASQLA
jgi:hypothetical protein